MLNNMIHLIKSLVSDDTGIFQKVKAKFFNQTQDVNVLNMYGISFNPPDNSFGVAFRANNDSANNIFAMIDRPDLRFTGLAKGELKIGNYVTGNSVLFKVDGTIEITATTVKIIGDLDVTGDISTSAIASLNAHTHSGVESGGSNTGGPT